MVGTTVLFAGNLADLKAAGTDNGQVYILIAKNTAGDFLGGIYRFDSSSSATEDLVHLNVITSDVTPTGRWVRAIQRVKILPHGILVNNGGIKTFYASGVTNGSGEYTLNLTEDNTAGGVALFSEILFNQSMASTPALTVQNAVSSFVKAVAADKKQTTHAFYRTNAVTVSILGAVVIPLAATPAGIPVSFRIDGM